MRAPDVFEQPDTGSSAPRRVPAAPLRHHWIVVSIAGPNDRMPPFEYPSDCSRNTKPSGADGGIASVVPAMPWLQPVGTNGGVVVTPKSSTMGLPSSSTLPKPGIVMHGPCRPAAMM